MKSLGVVFGFGVVLGSMVIGACGSEPADGEDGPDTGTDSAEVTDAFAMLCGHGGGYHRDPDFDSQKIRKALGAGTSRLASLQADTTGDNARNGLDDADPDDGGWDFILAPSATQHTSKASPPNLFGAIGLAAWAAVDSRSAATRGLVTALDAGTGMQRNPQIDSAPDFVFGVLLADLADNPGFAQLARARYEAKRAANGGATGLGDLIRDARHSAKEDGLIPYDIGWMVLGAAALDSAFPGAGFDADADTYAQIVVDDLTSATPRFDFMDPAEAFYITGVAWAQVSASRLDQRALQQKIRTQLISQQHTNGAWPTNAAAPGDDLQSTAHALQTLALTDRKALRSTAAEGRAARFLLRAQGASGGWGDAAGNELPLVDADIMIGLMLAGTEAGDDGLVSHAPLVAETTAGKYAAPRD